jgi:CheY-like chemotaxis protein
MKVVPPLTDSAAPPPAVPHDVLIVEDDAIIALDFEDAVRSCGVPNVRCAADTFEALQAIEARPPDFALLDVGLGSGTSFAVAERLDALGIPFAIVTGYSSDVQLLARYASRPMLGKPYVMDELAALLQNWRTLAE